MSESLSKRATAYLSSLQRLPRVSTDRLRELMIEQGVEPVDTWLDFHDRYAGYVEKLGSDGAVWGIVHEQARFFENPNPLTIDHDYYEHEHARVVRCADAHPSYDYMLTEDGSFLGRPAQSFETYIEQAALWQEFLDQHPDAQVKHVFDDSALIVRIEAESTVVPEASDQYHSYNVGEKILGIREVETGRWIRTIIADPEPGNADTLSNTPDSGLFDNVRKWLKR